MEITIEITTSNNVTRLCPNTLYNIANCAVFSGIITFVQPFAQFINDIFVSNFLLFCCIRNATKAITTLSVALYSAIVKLLKTSFLDMRIRMEITTLNNVTGRVQTPFPTLLTVRLLVTLLPLSNSSPKSLMTFSFRTFYSIAVFEIQHR